MTDEAQLLPRARRDDSVVVKELPDEVLVYDLRRNKLHCLNRASALVWQHCDGQTSVGEMAEHLARAGLPRDPRIVHLALEQLEKVRLLDQPAPARTLRQYTRRSLLKQAGIVGGLALALPLIQSIVAPSVAQAATCVTTCNAANLGRVCCAGGTCRRSGPTFFCG